MLKNPSTSNNKKERNINLKYGVLVCVLLAFLFQNFTLVSQNTNVNSPALETLLQQIDENYVPPGWNDTMNNMEKLSKTIPQVYFTFLGAAMNKQEYYINNNSIASQNFKNLNREILFQIPDLVDYRNSLNPNDYERIDDNTLGDLYNDALFGTINENFSQAYKENTGKDLSQISMPSVLDQNTVGGTSFRKVAKKDKNEIKLLEEVAPAATIDPNKKDPDVSNLPYSTGKCPMQSNKKSVYVKTGTNCTYENGMLVYETQMVNHKNHGIRKYYRVEKGIHYMAASIPFTNDKEDGTEETYDYDDESGRVYLSRRIPYKSGLIDGTYEEYTMKYGYHTFRTTQWMNGKKHGVQEQCAYMSYGDGRPTKIYLKWKTVYAYDKRVESFVYKDDGSIISHTRYNSNGDRIEN